VPQADPAEVLAEIRRIFRPGGTYRFVEPVAAPVGTTTRATQPPATNRRARSPRRLGVRRSGSPR